MTTIRFERAAGAAPAAVTLDPGQQAVVDLSDGASAAVLGAPGTGKTTTILELVADRVLVRGWSPDDVLVLSSSRAAATRLRDLLALRLGRPTNGPLARTPSSFAFELVTSAARLAGAEPPRLLTGADQDADIAALLEGAIESGGGPRWPDHLGAEVRRLRGFRSELRELMARATEYQVEPARLRQLGAQTGRDEWVAAADFIDEYLAVVSGARENQFDSAELARFAIEAITTAPAGSRAAGIRLVVVDDMQEATESTIALLRAFAARGTAVIAFGDPDVAANAFRGGEPDALGRLSSVLGIAEMQQFVLPVSHRQTGALRAFTSRIVERIGTAAAGSQRAAAAPEAAPSIQPPLARIETVTASRQHAAIARVLREEHLARGVAWHEMAVVVRSGMQAPAIARALALAEVPTRTISGGTALRDESAARALLTLVQVGVGTAELTPELANELLLGPFGGLDSLELRRLRLALRAEELAAGGARTSSELLIEALSDAGRFVTIDTRPARAAGRFAETLALLRASEGTIEELLWLAWERSRLAEPWRELALGSGLLADEANRNLDAIVALFSAAKDYAERRGADFDDPRVLAASFIAETLRAEVANDVLAPVRGTGSVLVTTASATVGLEFRTVVVASLQDRLWPNLRPRGSLLGPQLLVRALEAGETSLDERKLVIDDELRMFALAVSRASERVVLAAVTNDDEARSLFVNLLPGGDAAVPLLDSASAPLSLRGMVGRLRRVVADPRAPSAEVRAAASSLAALSRLGLPGAHPDDWHGLAERSTSGRLYEGSTVRVSPSQIEKIEDSALDWFLESIAGGDSGIVANVGTVLHWAMETTENPTVDNLWAAVEQRWSELVFESPWLGERQRGLARGFTEALADYLRDFQASGGVLVGAEDRFQLELSTDELPPLPPQEPQEPQQPQDSPEPPDPPQPQPQILVSGSIDRVELDSEGGVVIVDLKTGRAKPAREVETLAQLGAYQLAYAEGKFDDQLSGYPDHHAGGAKLLFVRDGTTTQRYREASQPLLDADGLEQVRERIRQAAVIIASAEFAGRLELDAFKGFGTTPRLRMHRVKAVSSD